MLVTVASPTLHMEYARSEPHTDTVLGVKMQGKEAICLK